MGYVVYRILNLKTNRVYIGSTGNFWIRKSEHFGQLRNNKHCNGLLQSDFRIYKEANFVMEILQDHFQTREAMLLREYELILKNKGGYNIHTDCPVVNGSGSKKANKKHIRKGADYMNHSRKRKHHRRGGGPVIKEHPMLDKIAERKRLREISRGRNDD
jgi:group I intron endonuclease